MKQKILDNVTEYSANQLVGTYGQVSLLLMN